MLYDPLRHEVLSSTSWNADVTRTAVERIAAASIKQFSSAQNWPSHPLDDNGKPTRYHNLYLGAAGVIWALDYLARLGLAETVSEFSSTFDALFAANHDEIVASKSGANGLLIADSGLLLLGARLCGPEYVADRLSGAIDANQDNPVLELMWGSPGTMLAALFMYEWTGDEAWAGKFRRDAASLWNRMEHYEPAQCYLWRQELYGSSVLMLGGVHGFAGNAFPLIRGWNLLGAAEQQRWAERMEHALRATAVQQDGLMNWPPSVGAPRPGRTKILAQHCHGAPGMVNCLAHLPDARVDDLLLMGGELTWAAGPLSKGANLCHGTAGNGYAFLKLFQRTKDELWLDRARRFAMHSLEQSNRDLQQYGQLRYSLWTGDLGLAIYLWHCIQATDVFPTMDVF